MFQVLMTADTVGGVWTYALDLCRGLGAHGVRVALATMGEPLRPEQWRAVSTLPNVEVHESRYKLVWMREPWNDVAAAGDWLLDLASRIRPDIVHLNDYAHGDLAWPAPVLVVGHSCVLSWWRAVHGAEAPAEWCRYRRRVTAGLRAAQAVVAPTLAMLEELERLYGPLAATRVIANGRDPGLYRKDKKEPLVLAAGRVWDEAKNIATLARAAGRLKWPVCVAGDARHPDGGEAHFENVRLLGRQAPADLADWYARAAIYALPARYEPFGLSALEAAFSGCALVLSRIPTLVEVWQDTALFVPPDDADALARTLNCLIEDADLRGAYALRAERRARLYSLNRMAREYLQCYRSLIAPPPRQTIREEAIRQGA